MEENCVLKRNLMWYSTILQENFNESWNVRYPEERKYKKLTLRDGNLMLSCCPKNSVAGT
jgi:hypothetical protein